jgi:hypothetical protein
MKMFFLVFSNILFMALVYDSISNVIMPINIGDKYYDAI